MSAKVQARPKSSIFHKYLIKLLVVDHLKEINIIWDRFLFSGGFVETMSPKPQANK